MNKLASYLVENGPTPITDIPKNSISLTDKRQGVTWFKLKSGLNSRSPFSSTDVVYLIEEHDPKAVIKAWLDANPEHYEKARVDESWRRAFGNHMRQHGHSWLEAWQSLMAQEGPAYQNS